MQILLTEKEYATLKKAQEEGEEALLGMAEVKELFPKLLEAIGGCNKEKTSYQSGTHGRLVTGYCDDCPLLPYRRICTRSRNVGK